jgi:hypothetical protein
MACGLGKTTSHTLQFFEFHIIYTKNVIMMDSEKYFTYSHSTLTRMDGFWTDNVENTSDAVKCKAVGKFELKV